jgi:hypothetical protein
MKTEIISQYKAALKMLVDVIVKCPDSLWANGQHKNAYWRIVYHSLFYTALYLADGPAEFRPWHKHRPNYNCLGTVTHDNLPIVIKESYLKPDMIDYANNIILNLDDAVSDVNYSERTGFDWIPMNRLQLHLYNIRHIQHHTGQLTERLHQAGIKGITWER